MTEKAIVYIVDDDDSVRNSLLRLLHASGLDAVGHASAGEFLLHRPPDRHGCIILDIRMPGPSGLDLQSVLKEQDIPMPVIFMTGHADVASCAAAMRAGAVDFLEKPVDPQALMEVISCALSRDTEARARRQERRQLEAAFNSLSERERQVFDLVVSGKLNKQIANTLNVAERTVKAQRARLMEKLGIESAAGLGRLAERLRAMGEPGGNPDAGFRT
jgi:RNA polymerase sigma factor (sigma-70 family)